MISFQSLFGRDNHAAVRNRAGALVEDAARNAPDLLSKAWALLAPYLLDVGKVLLERAKQVETAAEQHDLPRVAASSPSRWVARLWPYAVVLALLGSGYVAVRIGQKGRQSQRPFKRRRSPPRTGRR